MRVIPGEEEDMDTIYITGHRNPDTDSVISAMAYAALKNALGDRRYKAARLGQISDETQIVLDRFGFQPPRLLTDVRTQVRDLDYDTPPTLSPAATISRGWQTMQKERISALPVTNEDGTLYGMLSAGDVANYDMSSVRNPQVGEVPVYNLLSVLEGKILNEDGQIRDMLSGEVIIALPASRENLVSFDENSIVICGDHSTSWKRPSDGKDHCDIDIAICTEHLCLAATQMGLGTCWVCNFDARQCADILSLPPHIEPIVIVPIGYAKEPRVPEKSRKPLTEIIRWEKY